MRVDILIPVSILAIGIFMMSDQTKGWTSSSSSKYKTRYMTEKLKNDQLANEMEELRLKNARLERKHK